MKSVFADTFFYIAIANPHDPAHERATDFAASHPGIFLTTQWVLTEVADGMARSLSGRRWFAGFYARLCVDAYTRIVPFSEDLFAAGLDLYARRPDKHWSLTDCVSFVVMEREGITDALTGDHHFEQAGFVPLLK